MKKFITTLIAAILALHSLAYAENLIPDENFKACINATLDRNRDPATDITQTDLESLTFLFCHYENIKSVEGIEYAKNLINLGLYGNEELTNLPDIRSLNVLKYLEVSESALTELNLDCSGGGDCLNNLTDIDLLGDKITHLTLKNLPKLTHIGFGSNPCESIILHDLPLLENLNPLFYLVGDSLNYLELNNLAISDISPRAVGGHGCFSLFTKDAQIKITNMPRLNRLMLDRQCLRNEQLKLENLPVLKNLDLSTNKLDGVFDVPALKLPQLDAINLSSNNITEIKGNPAIFHSLLQSYPSESLGGGGNAIPSTPKWIYEEIQKVTNQDEQDELARHFKLRGQMTERLISQKELGKAIGETIKVLGLNGAELQGQCLSQDELRARCWSGDFSQSQPCTIDANGKLNATKLPITLFYEDKWAQVDPRSLYEAGFSVCLTLVDSFDLTLKSETENGDRTTGSTIGGAFSCQLEHFDLSTNAVDGQKSVLGLSNTENSKGPERLQTAQNIQCTAEPEDGYRIKEWQMSGEDAQTCEGDDATACVLKREGEGQALKADTTITAVFEKVHKVTATIEGKGSLVCGDLAQDMSQDSIFVWNGQSASCTLTPAAGYGIASVKNLSNCDKLPQYSHEPKTCNTVSITQDIALTVTFKPVYTLKIDAMEGTNEDELALSCTRVGDTDPLKNDGANGAKVMSDEQIICSVGEEGNKRNYDFAWSGVCGSANSGVTISGANKSTDSYCSLKVADDLFSTESENKIAVDITPYYKVTFTPPKEGEAPQTEEVKQGGKAEFTYTYDSSRQTLTWSGCSEDNGDTCTVSDVKEDKTVSATLDDITYNPSSFTTKFDPPEAEGYFNVNCTGEGKVDSSMTCTAVKKDQNLSEENLPYRFSRITTDKESVDVECNGTACTFTMPVGGVTAITAYFDKRPEVIGKLEIIPANSEITETVSCAPQYVDAGGESTCTLLNAIPEHYELVWANCTQDAADEKTKCTISNVQSNQIVTATLTRQHLLTLTQPEDGRIACYASADDLAAQENALAFDAVTNEPQKSTTRRAHGSEIYCAFTPNTAINTLSWTITAGTAVTLLKVDDDSYGREKDKIAFKLEDDTTLALSVTRPATVRLTLAPIGDGNSVSCDYKDAQSATQTLSSSATENESADVLKGSEVSCTARAAQDWAFEAWTLDNNAASMPISMNSDHTLSATFKKNNPPPVTPETVKLTLAPIGDGNSVSCDYKDAQSATQTLSSSATENESAEVLKDSEVSCTANAAQDWAFKVWTLDNADKGNVNPLKFTPNADSSLAATFEKTGSTPVTPPVTPETVKLTLEAITEGSVSCDYQDAQNATQTLRSSATENESAKVLKNSNVSCKVNGDKFIWTKMDHVSAADSLKFDFQGANFKISSDTTLGGRFIDTAAQMLRVQTTVDQAATGKVSCGTNPREQAGTESYRTFWLFENATEVSCTFDLTSNSGYAFKGWQYESEDMTLKSLQTHKNTTIKFTPKPGKNTIVLKALVGKGEPTAPIPALPAALIALLAALIAGAVWRHRFA